MRPDGAKKIFVYHDDCDTFETARCVLHLSGFEVAGFDTSEMFWQRLSEEIPDLIILEVMLPRGFSVLEDIKNSYRTTHAPVMILSEKNSEHNIVKGLDSGADDYLAKPFSSLELVARVNALIRRGEGSNGICQQVIQKNQAQISFGGLLLDSDRRIVKIGGVVAELTFNEFELLHFLLKHKETVVTRTQLLSQVWSNTRAGADTRTIDAHINTVRKKLGYCGALIKTVHRVGYKIALVNE